MRDSSRTSEIDRWVGRYRAEIGRPTAYPPRSSPAFRLETMGGAMNPTTLEGQKKKKKNMKMKGSAHK